MKTAAEWIVEQSINNPRVGSLEHKIMCDAIRAIQRDALLEAFKLVREKHSITGAADAILEYAETLTPHFHSTSGGLTPQWKCDLGNGEWDHDWKEIHDSSGEVDGGPGDHWTQRECRVCGEIESDNKTNK